MSVSRLLGELLEQIDSAAFAASPGLESTMKQKKSWRHIAGLTVHVIVGGFMLSLGGLMIATAWARLVCLPLPGAVEAVVQFEISDYLLPRLQVVEVALQIDACICLMVIGVGQLVTGLHLMTPSTSLAGALLASSFWGAAICLRMTHQEPYLLQSVILVLSWIGAYLRNPTVLGGLSGCRRNTAAINMGNGVAESPCALLL